MIMDPDTLRKAILQAVKSDPLSRVIETVQVEPALDEDDEEFLRVELSVRLPDRDVDAELESLLEKIEEAVGAIDERYPSVRFLDAA